MKCRGQKVDELPSADGTIRQKQKLQNAGDRWGPHPDFEE